MNDPIEMKDIYDQAFDCLMTTNPQNKAEKTCAFEENLHKRENWFESAPRNPIKIEVPGRPLKPELINAKDVPRRGLGSVEGRIALLHALAHIEFNAINLALDAVYRFREMPKQYVLDWARVAREEVYHFGLISDRLNDLGSYYGAMPSHNGLWDMAVRTDHDVMVRMALVPRVMEARGLDVAPKMIEKLRHLGDEPSAAILDIIYRDEIDHVRIGNHWFIELCRQRDVQPQETFVNLVEEYTHGFLRGPFNKSARTLAGFTDKELSELERLDANNSK